MPLHSLVYKNFSAKFVIHCHPPLINGYFAVAKALKAMSFETKFYLGDIPVIPQETPTVTNPAPVIAALKTNNLVILKNHGTVAIGAKFEEALSITEALEEAVKSAAVARLFDKNILDDLERSVSLAETEKQDLSGFLKGVEMILAHLYEMLKEYGVKPIEAEGKLFDPHYHEALLQIENKELPEHTVVEELQKGYLLNERVVRTAKVKVSKKNLTKTDTQL